MTKHFAELEHSLKMLKQLTGIPLNISADTPEEAEQALIQVQRLCAAYREKYTPGQFLKNLLTQDMAQEDIIEEALRLHIAPEEPRVLILLDSREILSETVTKILKLLFPAQTARAFIPVTPNRLAILYALPARKSRPGHKVSGADVSSSAAGDSSEQDFSEAMRLTSRTVIDTLNAEALISVRLSYSHPFELLSELHTAYEETSVALQIGKLFYPEQTVFPYNRLGAGRLITQLPPAVCEKFLSEIWKEGIPLSIDPELQSTVNCFLQNNLNIAETARQLHMHRNTLIYRLNQIQKETGLDLRNFEDAMLYKLAVMILHFLQRKDNSL